MRFQAYYFAQNTSKWVKPYRTGQEIPYEMMIVKR